MQGEIFLRLNRPITEKLIGPDYRTFIWKEIPRPISPEMLHMSLMAGFEKALGRPIERGTPKQAETRISKRIDLELLEEAGELLGTEIVFDDH